jgi:hypothetical protein
VRGEDFGEILSRLNAINGENFVVLCVRLPRCRRSLHTFAVLNNKNSKFRSVFLLSVGSVLDIPRNSEEERE